MHVLPAASGIDLQTAAKPSFVPAVNLQRPPAAPWRLSCKTSHPGHPTSTKACALSCAIKTSVSRFRGKPRLGDAQLILRSDWLRRRLPCVATETPPRSRTYRFYLASRHRYEGGEEPSARGAKSTACHPPDTKDRREGPASAPACSTAVLRRATAASFFVMREAPLLALSSSFCRVLLASGNSGSSQSEPSLNASQGVASWGNERASGSAPRLCEARLPARDQKANKGHRHHRCCDDAENSSALRAGSSSPLRSTSCSAVAPLSSTHSSTFLYRSKLTMADVKGSQTMAIVMVGSAGQGGAREGFSGGELTVVRSR